MVLIGSRAIKYWYPDFPREPKDTDYIIGENETREKTKGYEFLINPILYKKYPKHLTHVCSPKHLTTLKASHLMWNLNWDKHMFDLQFLLKKGNKIDEELFWKLYDYWNEYHGKNKRSDLKMTKDEFFNNAVNYDTLEHDQTHTILNPVPIYTKILKDGCDVELDEEKYKTLSHEDKMDLVREEVMVMAEERFKHLNFRVAYSKMLTKFIISHAPKFTLIDILTNYIELHRAPYNFIEKINKHKQLITV